LLSLLSRKMASQLNHTAHWSTPQLHHGELKRVLDPEPKLHRGVGVDGLGGVEAKDGPLHERKPGDVHAQPGSERLGDIANDVAAQIACARVGEERRVDVADANDAVAEVPVEMLG